MEKEVKICYNWGTWWTCENADLLAPIAEVGTAYLLNDGVYYAKDGGTLPFTYRWATMNEYIEHAHKRGYVLIGDKVIVIKGGKIPDGTKKVVKNFSREYVPYTHHKYYTDWAHFTDGTKTIIKNIRVVGFENVEHTFKCEDIRDVFYVGGRI